MKNKNLKVGDKLLCIQDHINNKISISKDQEYEIVEITLNYWEELDNDDDEVCYYIYDDNYSSIEINIDEDMNKYFYTKQDIRKIKIEKLNNIYEKSEY